MHPSCNAQYDGAAWTNLNGWQPGTGTTLYHETVIDLSGYAMESLTFFPAAIGLQDPGIYLFKGSDTSPFTGLQVLDIVTSVPMDVSQVAADQNGAVGPAMLGSLYEFETILFGMYRFFSLNSNVPYLNYQQLERSQRFDSGEPNASDKLFCYRIVTPLTQDLTPESILSIPAARQLIGGAMDEESELIYMQRLKRSYELANQV
tara:strand:+ start:164 stop:775 length:612 start_codon:yes stop_codon:yes gene_type:complete